MLYFRHPQIYELDLSQSAEYRFVLYVDSYFKSQYTDISKQGFLFFFPPPNVNRYVVHVQMSNIAFGGDCSASSVHPNFLGVDDVE